MLVRVRIPDIEYNTHAAHIRSQWHAKRAQS